MRGVYFNYPKKYQFVYNRVMTLQWKSINNIDALKACLKQGDRGIPIGSRTSMVIPFEKIEAFVDQNFPQFNGSLWDLSGVPPQAELDGDVLKVRGHFTWQEAKSLCMASGRQIMTSPTEELAAILSGVATSATGERCFAHGTLRDQVESIRFVDSRGEEQELSRQNKLIDHPLFQEEAARDILRRYQKDYELYKGFKNAPFPRLEFETDLMSGFEGQLGVITEVHLQTIAKCNLTYIFLNLPRWDQDFAPHIEVFEKIQNYRDRVYSCEFIDHHSLGYLPEEMRPVVDGDIVFLEIDENSFEDVYESLLSQISSVNIEQMFEMSQAKCQELRVNIPRYVFESNQKMGVLKKGTDVQVRPGQFADLMALYKGMTQEGVPYTLFGHFGDAHLHFNYMPRPDQVDTCQKILEELYRKVIEMKGSPFAEHGIGLIKQPFIKGFYRPAQREMFSLLKNYFDPNNQFFPMGFMSLDG